MSKRVREFKQRTYHGSSYVGADAVPLAGALPLAVEEDMAGGGEGGWRGRDLASRVTDASGIVTYP